MLPVDVLFCRCFGGIQDQQSTALCILCLSLSNLTASSSYTGLLHPQGRSPLCLLITPQTNQTLHCNHPPNSCLPSLSTLLMRNTSSPSSFSTVAVRPPNTSTPLFSQHNCHKHRQIPLARFNKLYRQPSLSFRQRQSPEQQSTDAPLYTSGTMAPATGNPRRWEGCVTA